MRPSIKKTYPGVGIAETVVYIGVLLALLLISVNSLLALRRALSVIQATRHLTSAEHLAFERMTRVIRDADDVSVSSNSLTLTGSETPVLTHRFLLIRTTLVEDTGAGMATLTPPGVAVTSLSFSSVTATHLGVKIQATFEAWQGRGTTTHTLYSTVQLRN